MIRIEFNDDGIQVGLDGLSQLLSDMTPVFQDIGEALAVSTENRFVAGEAPDGSAWAPKSKATLAKYARGKDPVSDKPLHGPSLQLSRTIYYEAGASEVLIGSPMIYAGMMQLGGAKANFPHLWGDIPARPYLGVSDEDRGHILDIIAEHMALAARGQPE